MDILESKIDEQEPAEIHNFGEFDMEYFQELEGQNGWIALGQPNCMNQRYFTVIGKNGEKLGIIGVYDTAKDDEKNVTHIVVDPKYRGQGLSAKIQELIMDELNLPFITITISLDNDVSIRATEKLTGVKKVSDTQYEHDFFKVKYILERKIRDLIKLLKEKGPNDDVVKKLLENWTREQEEQAEKAQDFSLAQIIFNLERARLYLNAGYFEEATENYESARMQAWNEKRTDLYQQIMQEMDKFEV